VTGGRLHDRRQGSQPARLMRSLMLHAKIDDFHFAILIAELDVDRITLVQH
jgi:hypothetical protein